MKKTHAKRNWFTTITAAAIGLVILITILPAIPLVTWTEIGFFGIGVLLIVMCAVIALGGKDGQIKEIVHSMIFWS